MFECDPRNAGECGSFHVKHHMPLQRNYGACSSHLCSHTQRGVLYAALAGPPRSESISAIHDCPSRSIPIAGASWTCNAALTRISKSGNEPARLNVSRETLLTGPSYLLLKDRPIEGPFSQLRRSLTILSHSQRAQSAFSQTTSLQHLILLWLLVYAPSSAHLDREATPVVHLGGDGGPKQGLRHLRQEPLETREEST